ncbi:MAG: RNA polymerase sigma factor [Pseudomonadota bacterium]|nr:RNA polymerase sigma factor [Pseudomonadota bacterium]
MDHNTFDQFLDHWQNDIYRMIRSRVNVPADAEDIMQEVLLKLYRGLDSFRGESQLKTWIYRLVKNAIADYYRKPWWKFDWVLEREFPDGSKSQPALEQYLDEQQVSALDAVLSKEQGKRLLKLVNRLSAAEKEYFTLRFLDGFSLLQISEATDKNLNTIKTHLYRAVKKMRAYLLEES